MAYRVGCWGVNPPPLEIWKTLQNRAKLNPTEKTVKNRWISDAHTPNVRKKGSKILKLPPVRNCFTFSIRNKLVVFINSLKVPKIKKTLRYEMKFLLSKYSCLQNPWLVCYRQQISVLSVLKWICWTPSPNKIPGYATDSVEMFSAYTQNVKLKVLYFSIYFTYVMFRAWCMHRKF